MWWKHLRIQVQKESTGNKNVTRTEMGIKSTCQKLSQHPESILPRDHLIQRPFDPQTILLSTQARRCTGQALAPTRQPWCWAEHFVVQVAELLGARALEQREPFPEGNLQHLVAQQPQLPPLQAVQPQQPLGAVAEVVPVGHLQCQPHFPRLPAACFRLSL